MYRMYVVLLNGIPEYSAHSRIGACNYIRDCGGELGDGMYQIHECAAQPYRNWIGEVMRQLNWAIPDADEARDFLAEEVGECLGARVQLKGRNKWHRSNPDRHRNPDPNAEAADAFFMAALSCEGDAMIYVKEKFRERGWKDLN